MCTIKNDNNKDKLQTEKGHKDLKFEWANDVFEQKLEVQIAEHIK